MCGLTNGLTNCAPNFRAQRNSSHELQASINQTSIQFVTLTYPGVGVYGDVQCCILGVVACCYLTVVVGRDGPVGAWLTLDNHSHSAKEYMPASHRLLTPTYMQGLEL